MLLHCDPDPVKRTELLEEVPLEPIHPFWLATKPPFEITRLLLLPEIPITRSPLLVRRVLVFATVSRLLEDATELPT